MNKEREAFDYFKLQRNLDRIIDKVGLQRTVCLLENFSNNMTIKIGEHQKIKLVMQFVINAAIQIFELEPKLFFICDIREYRDARMACYHLLRKYTGDTFARIGLAFQCSERAVTYGNMVAEQRLELPKGHKSFVTKYSQIESQILEFIGKLN
jgi:hypothetical protein